MFLVLENNKYKSEKSKKKKTEMSPVTGHSNEML